MLPMPAHRYVTTGQLRVMGAMRAEGCTQREIGLALGLRQSQVYVGTSMPQVKAPN